MEHGSLAQMKDAIHHSFMHDIVQTLASLNLLSQATTYFTYLGFRERYRCLPISPQNGTEPHLGCAFVTAFCGPHNDSDECNI